MLFFLLSLLVLFINIGVGSIDVDKDITLEPVGNGVLFEGDMVVSKKDVDLFLNKGGIEEDQTYGLMKQKYKRWPNGVIPFVLDKSVINQVLRKIGIKGPTERAILHAIEAWERKTCLKFKKRTKERDYIEFFDGGSGKCYSNIGRVGGKQQISIGFGCFTTGIVIHEIGHALGLYHEQSRPDRDDYVEIIWKNIPEKHKHNFAKYNRFQIDSRGSPYDYDSIMHYSKSEFAKFPFFTTIRAKKSGASIGQRSHISKEDAWQINKFYECKM